MWSMTRAALFRSSEAMGSSASSRRGCWARAAGDVHPLLFAAGEGVGPLVSVIGHAHPAKERVG